jgi:WD40 repeat protein/nitrous oxidase accessory protein NosD
MRGAKLLGIGAALALVALAAGTAKTSQVTITVCASGCQFSSIQMAILSAPEGSTIQVRAGVYKEILIISKPLSLTGEGADKTVLEGGIIISGMKAPEAQVSPLVLVVGFAVKGQGVLVQNVNAPVLLHNNAFLGSNRHGLLIINSARVTLLGSTLQENQESGVAIISSQLITLTNNNLLRNAGDGISISASSVEVRGNIAKGNKGCGIRASDNSSVTGEVKAGEVTGNQLGLCGRALAVFDKTPPSLALAVKGPTRITDVTVPLSLTASDDLSGVDKMRLSNDGKTWSDWQPFQSDISWDLRPYGGSTTMGPRTVYAQVRDGVENVSPTASVSIFLASVSLTGHTNWVNSVAFSPDGRLLASGSRDYTIKLWEVATGSLVRTLEGHTNWVNSVAFSPDGRLLASGSSDRTIKLWEVASGSLVRTLSGHTSDVNSVAFSPDGRLLASGSDDRTIKLWEVATGSLVRTLTGHEGSVRSVAFSPDGRLLASGSWDDTIKLWEVASGSLVRTLSGHTSDVNSVAFSPDGRLLASGSSDRTIKLWEVASGSLVRSLSGHTDLVRSVAFSPDGRLLASGGCKGGDVDDRIQLWDVSSGQRLSLFQGHTGCVNSVAFSPDGRLLASGSGDATIKLWDISGLVGR